MDWKFFIQAIGVIVAATSCGFAILSYFFRKHEFLESQKNMRVVREKELEKELMTIQFDQLTARIDAVEEIFKDIAKELRSLHGLSEQFVIQIKTIEESLRETIREQREQFRNIEGRFEKYGKVILKEK